MNLNQSERHVFILWHNGLAFKDKLLSQIEQSFEISKASFVQWTPGLFLENLRRFYGPEASLISDKATVAGTGKFLAIIVKDKNPLYEMRQTTDGPRRVNIKVFDLKSAFRAELPNKWLLHSSVTKDEGVKDLALLFGQSTIDFEGEGKTNLAIDHIQNDLIGTHGFPHTASALRLLNELHEYVLLFEDPKNFLEHSESNFSGIQSLEILVRDRALAKLFLNAKERKNASGTGQVECFVKVGRREMRINFRDVFDGYFCPVWSNDILARRKEIGFANFPNDDDQFYTSLYHICVHGSGLENLYNRVSEVARTRGLNVSSEKDIAYHCRKFLVHSAYSAPQPSDSSLPESFGMRRHLVREGYKPGETKFSKGQQKQNDHANLKEAIPNNIKKMLGQVSTTPPIMHKHSKGWYESKIWRCQIDVPNMFGSLCLKHERFESEEMREHAQTKAPQAIAHLIGDYTPRVYGCLIEADSLIVCSEWIEGLRLFENIKKIVSNLIANDELDAFIDSLYGYLNFLDRIGIEHRDIWEKNIIVRNHRPVFVDFTWACLKGEGSYYPPEALYRNDSTSIERIVDKVRALAAD